MKIGKFEIKKKYTIAQILVDVFSVGVLAYIGFMIYACAVEITQIKDSNLTGQDLSFLNWEPLLVWAGVALIVTAVSVFLILKNKKFPEKYYIDETNVVKYANIVDTAISCIRLVVLLALSEVCYLHYASILLRNSGFPVQLICDLVLAVIVLVFTRMRLESISDIAKEKAGETNKREIVID